MILMAGQKIDAPTAQDWGLVDRVVEEARLGEEVAALGADAMAASGAHVAGIKRLIP